MTKHLEPMMSPEFRSVRDVNGHAGGESRDMRVTLEVSGHSDTIREVVDFVHAAPTMYRALNAILSRMNGVFDSPDLLAFGPLSESADRDVQRIACHALEAAEGHGNIT